MTIRKYPVGGYKCYVFCIKMHDGVKLKVVL